jgi:hypothetical protein
MSQPPGVSILDHATAMASPVARAQSAGKLQGGEAIFTETILERSPRIARQRPRTRRNGSTLLTRGGSSCLL